MTTAFVFPGQGAQRVGMLRAETLHDPSAARLVALAEEISGAPLAELMLHGPEETLRDTRYAQPALLLAGLLAARAATARGYQAAVVMGHSLGEYTALTHAGALGLEDAIATVTLRGALMARAVEDIPGTMAAIVRPDEEQVRRILQAVSTEGVVEVANDNGPSQLVISGDVPVVEEACRRIEAERAGRPVPLEVSAPFHSSRMAPVVAPFAAHLAGITIEPPRMTFIANVTGEPEDDPERLRALLVDQITSPVLWRASVETARAQGVTTYVECGPGRVLRGLVRRIHGDATLVGMEAP